jgi:hypothetical protein
LGTDRLLPQYIYGSFSTDARPSLINRTETPLVSANAKFIRQGPEDLVAAAHHRTKNKLPGVKIFALKNTNGEIVETSIHGENATPDFFEP